MGFSRAECAVMTDAALQVAIDGRRSRLRHDWDRGRPGQLFDVFDLAVLLAESAVRGYAVSGPVLPGQMTFDYAVWSEVMRQPRPTP